MLTPYLPYPLHSGGQIRSYNLLKNLSKKHQITLFSFIRLTDEKKYMEYCVMLGFPGETTEEKMANNKFTLIPSQRKQDERESNLVYPEIVKEAVQVYECSVEKQWVDQETQEYHSHRRYQRKGLNRSHHQCLFVGEWLQNWIVHFTSFRTGERKDKGQQQEDFRQRTEQIYQQHQTANERWAPDQDFL